MKLKLLSTLILTTFYAFCEAIFYDTTSRLNYTTMIECFESYGHTPQYYIHNEGRMTIIPSNNTDSNISIYDAAIECSKVSNFVYGISVCDGIYEDDVVESRGMARDLIEDTIEIVVNTDPNALRSGVSTNPTVKRSEGLVTVQHDVDTKNCGALQPIAILQQGKCLVYRTKPYDKSTHIDWRNTAVDLKVEIWPHHRCGGGGYRLFIVKKGDPNYCLVANSYSAKYNQVL